MSNILPGCEIIFRNLRWEVVDVQASGEDEIYRIRGSEGIFIGREMEILASLEEIQPLVLDLNPEKASRLQHWALFHQAYLLEQSLGDKTLLSYNSGRIKAEPYQLVPLMRALKMSRPRLLMCDDVGLGKTIQAAQVIIELMSRRLAHRVLIVSPAGPLLNQWKQEMLDKFSLKVEMIDRAKIEEIRRKSELGANPFDYVPLGLISVDFLKQERILEYAEKTSYDIIVIDEAHHCADTGSALGGDESLRRKLATVLASRCDYLLLLTATPHNGIDRSFASLLELLDPSLVNGRGEVIADKYKPHVIRRLKKHIKNYPTNEPKFKERKVTPVAVVADGKIQGDYIDFQKELLGLISPELRKAIKNRNYGDVLAYIALLKRSVSSVNACVETLKAIKERLEGFIAEKKEDNKRKRERVEMMRDYVKKSEKFGVLSYEEEEDQKALHAEHIAEQFAGNLSALESELRKGTRKIKHVQSVSGYLDELIELGERCKSHDPKLDALAAEINKIHETEPGANIIVYTEYTDSQTVAVEKVKAACKGEVLTLSGNDPEKTRGKITNNFSVRDGQILISTDASSEGLNLQKKCHHLIHLELPFNPNRLEQRNGRIDRYGQHLTPEIKYLYLRNTFEDRILIRLIAKYEKQRKLLGFVPETLGITCSTDNGCDRLLKGIVEEETKLFKQGDDMLLFNFEEPEKEKVSDDAINELLSEIDKSFTIYKTSKDSNVLLLESGINNENNLVAEAAGASEDSKIFNIMNMKKFVCDAITFDGGEVKELGAIFEINKLPVSWQAGLEELPGYNAERRSIRLTEDLNVTEDEDKNPVGYLGRAHPIIKKAIDRVKSVNFISREMAKSDPRITAIKDKVKEPEILFTFSGHILTKRSKALEKVFGIKVGRTQAPKEMLNSAELMEYVDMSKSVDVSGVWERHFSCWAGNSMDIAFKMALEIFAPIAGKYMEEYKKRLKLEAAEIESRFVRRVEELTGGISANVMQFDLFENPDSKGQSTWIGISDPKERILKFTADKNVKRSIRSTAETALLNYEKRMKEIENLMTVENTGVSKLGMMMIIPEEVK